jgi:predicted RNase H-like HicB family nuclease
MKHIKIIIEKTKDNYSAYAENLEGIYGGGETVAEAKQSILDAIKLYKKYNKKSIPKVLEGEYEIIYKFDTQSLLNYYKGIFTNASLERITGIKQKQIQHYASGLKKPRAAQKQKIQDSLHTLAGELMAVEL